MRVPTVSSIHIRPPPAPQHIAFSRASANSSGGAAPPLEFALAREKAMCCGAGGGRMWIDETIGTRINILRVEQALEVSPQTIATACPYCAVMMEDGLAALPAAGTNRSRDIAELVAAALVAEAPGAQESPAATARLGA